jgi:DNA-binding CsgD family transcriptional regulator
MSGKSSREIGKALGISSKTVESHRTNMSAKTLTRSVAELVLLGVAAGMLVDGSWK